MIKEIHIVHHTHTDFGYTDLPSTIREQQVRYIGEAVDIARRTESFPPDARFRWTCEVLLPVADFLAQATPAERRGFDRAFEHGQIELGAMPAIMSGLMWAEELEASLEALRPIFKKYHPRTIFQNDVNGLPWGILPRMRKAGARYVWMGINSYSGLSPVQRPAVWWWEGPDGARTLTYLNNEYNHGYNLFYPKHWRRGPVPKVADVWYHPPEARDTWDDSAGALREAHAHCLKKLEEYFGHWPFAEIAVQVTNMWRFDNDPPCAQLPRFVRAWNAAGLLPRLRLSTPKTFLDILTRKYGKKISALRGDWQDWWDDGPTAMPAEVAVSQRAKRLLSDLPGGRRALRSRATGTRKASEGWRQALLFSEHTYAPFDSVAQPYAEQTVGHCSQSVGNAYQALEQAKLGQMELIRSAPAYLRSAHARHVAVVNPGPVTRSGWADVKATALRFSANAVRDVKSGRVFPLENIPGPQWSEADPALPRPFEVPEDAWNFGTEVRRFFVSALAPGETRVFEFVEVPTPALLSRGERGKNAHFSWNWNPRTGRLSALTPQGEGSWVDSTARYGFAEPVIALPQGFGAWGRLLNRKPQNIPSKVPRFAGFSALPAHDSARFQRTWEHSNFHRIQQIVDIFHDAPIVEIQTIFWFKETPAPQAVLLAFPLSLPRAKVVYQSMGWPTEAGRDQLPESCGEHVMVNQGVEFFSGKIRTIALSTPDNPLGCLGEISLRTRRRAATPTNAHFFSVISNSYWMTNFPITRAAKVCVRHRLSPTLALSELTGDLWTFPCAAKST